MCAVLRVQAARPHVLGAPTHTSRRTTCRPCSWAPHLLSRYGSMQSYVSCFKATPVCPSCVPPAPPLCTPLPLSFLVPPALEPQLPLFLRDSRESPIFCKSLPRSPSGGTGCRKAHILAVPGSLSVCICVPPAPLSSPLLSSPLCSACSLPPTTPTLLALHLALPPP